MKVHCNQESGTIELKVHCNQESGTIELGRQYKVLENVTYHRIC